MSEMFLYIDWSATLVDKRDKTVGEILSAPFPMPQSHLAEQAAQPPYSNPRLPNPSLISLKQALISNLRGS